ncbi:helix-turn-helix domain-containing protein (plasmid) [Microvirga terrae]|uniref:Helix-turn-helix domain-containing protein n=1 Tax=Microvirga terrae TaxID=2740529 RepID=A0ABY5RY89_9HYPH|nr:helix-turn-helix domain-containing protein [Microvirga terrae]UVF22245.1 helix-turn-helix domain-containing protein [Microvirga terrae]
MPILPSFSFEGSLVSAPEEAYWIWRNIVSPLFDVAVADTQAVASFQVKIDSYHFGPLLLGSVAASGQEFRRSPVTIARSGVDHYLVQLYPVGGYAGDAEGRTVHVHPGDLSILDLSRTMHTRAETFQNLSLVVPRSVLEPLVRNPDGLHGLVLSGQSSLGHLLATYLSTVYQAAGSLSSEDGARISNATASLVAACFGPAADAHETTTIAKRAALILTIKRYIDNNLADPLLTVDSIGREFRLSRATLGRMFEPLGGLAAFIRARRMLRCFSEITSSAHAHRSIADIAYSWGFNNETAFSRTFRGMFDMSPREARAEGASAHRTIKHLRPGSNGSGQPILAEWIQYLRV